MQKVWVTKAGQNNGQPFQADEAQPGLLGQLGYTYTNPPATQPTQQAAPQQSAPQQSSAQVGSQAWYQLQPGESIPAYNARIASASPNLPAPGTTSPTGVTNNATPGNLLTTSASTSPVPTASTQDTSAIQGTAATPGGFRNIGGFQSGSPSAANQGITSGLPSAPPTQPGGGLPPLPPVQSQAGSLSAFADALEAAVGRAKQQRNQLIGGIMQPQQGTLMASDFNSIIGNMNNASANFSTELVGRAMDYATPQFQTSNVPGVGLVEYQMDSLGQITGQRVIAPEQAEPYKATTFEQNGTMYQYYVDPKTGAAVSSPQPIFSSPQQNQYQYGTMTDPTTGDVYQTQIDPTTNQIVGQQLMYQGSKEASQAAEADQYVSQGTYQDGNGKQWFYGIKPDGTKDEYELSGAGTPPKPASTSTTPAAKPKIVSGGLTYSNQDYGDDSRALEAARGKDGYVYTPTYVQLYNAWVENGGSLADFKKTFPPEQYVNPNDASVPPHLRPKGATTSSSGIQYEDV